MQTGTTIGALVVTVLVGACTSSGSYRVRDAMPLTEVLVDEAGMAAGGYDVVAFHVEGVARAGAEKHSHSVEGETYLFASAANLERFVADPYRYLPAYGGYCALSVASNDYIPPATGDPEAWHIENGTLYFNYSKMVRKIWLSDVERNIARADQQWPLKVAAMFEAREPERTELVAEQ